MGFASTTNVDQDWIVNTGHSVATREPGHESLEQNSGCKPFSR
jgi:hypothetical protein